MKRKADEWLGGFLGHEEGEPGFIGIVRNEGQGVSLETNIGSPTFTEELVSKI